MSHPDDLDRALAEWLQDGPYQAPEEPVNAAIRHASRTPRRRDLLAAFRPDPMRLSRASGPFRLGFGAAALLLIAIVVAGVGGFLLLQQAPPPGPSPTPSATSSPGPTASATPAATSEPSPPASPAASRPPFLEPGDPIPDGLLGAWYDAQLAAFPWLLRAGDPYCVDVLDSTQDCSAWRLADGSDRIGYETIATIVGGRVTFYWLTGSCARQVSHYDFVLGTDVLTLHWASGSCVSGDYTFVRPGTNGAPAAPPQPAPS
jgi:hypothetical protein